MRWRYAGNLSATLHGANWATLSVEQKDKVTELCELEHEVSVAEQADLENYQWNSGRKWEARVPMVEASHDQGASGPGEAQHHDNTTYAGDSKGWQDGSCTALVC